MYTNRFTYTGQQADKLGGVAKPKIDGVHVAEPATPGSLRHHYEVLLNGNGKNIMKKFAIRQAVQAIENRSVTQRITIPILTIL
jgi:hypothetical protein